jgi:hypothetical protein
MPKRIETKHPHGGITVSYQYTDEELIAAWNDLEGQGNAKARANGDWCVTVPCTQEEALRLSHLFVSHFNIPSCCVYRGGVWIAYCGDASSSADILRRRVEADVDNLLAASSDPKRMWASNVPDPQRFDRDWLNVWTAPRVPQLDP